MTFLRFVGVWEPIRHCESWVFDSRLWKRERSSRAKKNGLFIPTNKIRSKCAAGAGWLLVETPARSHQSGGQVVAEMTVKSECFSGKLADETAVKVITPSLGELFYCK